MIEQGPDTIIVRTSREAVVTIRYAFTPHLTITGGACVFESPDGWITARLPGAGTYEMGVDPSATMRGRDPSACRTGRVGADALGAASRHGHAIMQGTKGDRHGGPASSGGRFSSAAGPAAEFWATRDESSEDIVNGYRDAWKFSDATIGDRFR